MTALLSDGISAKGEAATGTFGNGHSVAIRYVLYGGLISNGDRICGGHAVVASWVVEDEMYQRSGDGFLIKAFRNASYEYAKGSSLPGMIGKNLDDIQNYSRHGTAVIITGFNNFRERHSLWAMVSKAAACNFFQAIEEGRLAVQVEDCLPEQSGETKELDRSTLKRVLEANRNEKRSKAFLSGKKAFEAHEALEFGKAHVVRTTIGTVRVRIRERSSGTPRVDLCRNGMWITYDKNIPGFYYAFHDRKPFHAILLLDSGSGGRLHELVRNAEGPLHDKLDARQRLSKPEAQELRQAFAEIRDWLRSTVPEIGSDSYSPDDFLALDFGQDGTGGRAQRSFWGTPVADQLSYRPEILDSHIEKPARNLVRARARVRARTRALVPIRAPSHILVRYSDHFFRRHPYRSDPTTAESVWNVRRTVRVPNSDCAWTRT